MPVNMPASATIQAPGQIGQILLLLLYLVLIIAGAYLVTRMLGKIAGGGIYSAKPNRRDGRKLILIERMPLGKEQSIVLLEYRGKRYLLGMGSDSFTLLDSEDAPEESQETVEKEHLSFMEALSSWKKQGEDRDAHERDAEK